MTENTKRAKKEKRDEKEYARNAIDLSPTLKEARSDTVVFGWGRMNPITTGHEKLANKIIAVARKEKATPLLYLTHSQDPKKNPLSYEDKYMLARKAFGNIVKKSRAKTIIQAMQELDKEFENVILIVGQDRIQEFETLLNKYNGKDFNFDSIRVVSAGDRDPDAEDVTGMSASKMRAMAAAGRLDDFKKGLPRKLQSDAEDIYDMVRSGMKINEMLELDEAILTPMQRRKRALTMRRYKSKIAAARRRLKKRPATKEKLQKRARKQAIQLIRKKVASKRGESYASLNPAEKMAIDKKVEKRKTAISRIAKRLLPKVKKADRARISDKSTNESFELFLEKTRVRQDPDIKDKKGTQPDVYYKGLAPSTKGKRDAHFRKGAKMDDDNPAAYKPAPGDARAETKPSKHTKKYQQMYGEEIVEASMNDTKPKKRYHEARKKDGSIKLDKRFRAFKSASKPGASDADMQDTFLTDADLLNFIEEVAYDISEELYIDEKKQIKGLKTKAEKTGISYDILKQVYDRGIAAWRTGHRPGTTPQQWAFARVNSFVTGGKTRTTADKDLWAKVKSKKEEIEEVLKQEGSKWVLYSSDGSKKLGEFDTKEDALKRERQIQYFKRKNEEATSISEEMSCPPATQDVELNTDNRNSTIENHMYGPLNVDEPADYWDKIADKWDTSVEAAKKSLCGNCVAFDISPRMEECMPGEISDDDGKLGYCWMHHFKCHSARTCDTWAKGGPITEDKISYEWQKRAFGDEEIDEDVGLSPALADYSVPFDPYKIKKLASMTVFRKRYAYAKKLVQDIYDRKKKAAKAAGRPMKHGREYYASVIARQVPGIEARILTKMIKEEYGDMDRGTDSLRKKYQQDTPNQPIEDYASESVPDTDEAMKRYKAGKAGFTDIAHLKAKGLISREDGTKRKSDKYKDVNEQFETMFENVTQKQLDDLEKFADRLLDKFDVDVEFTRHFADRMNDPRNVPDITVAELQRMFKKIAKNKAKNIKANANSEAVLKDMQSDLNLPVVIRFNRDKEEFEIVNKTIMRKKNFRTPDKVIEY